MLPYFHFLLYSLFGIGESLSLFFSLAYYIRSCRKMFKTVLYFFVIVTKRKENIIRSEGYIMYVMSIMAFSTFEREISSVYCRHVLTFTGFYAKRIWKGGGGHREYSTPRTTRCEPAKRNFVSIKLSISGLLTAKYLWR